MRLTNLLNRDFLLTKRDIKTKKEGVDQLFSAFVKNYKFLGETQKIEEEIKKREELGGTYLGNGLFLPHARIDDLDDILIGILTPQEPFTDEGVEVKIIVLILTSKNLPDVYLNILATLAKLVGDDALFTKVQECETPSSLLSLFNEKDIRIKEKATIEAIMMDEVVSISAESSIKELADLFYKHKTGYAAVIDENQNLLGEINVVMLLEEGIPEYARQAGGLQFLSAFSPLERLFKEEDTIKVKEVMVEPEVVFNRETSLAEAAFEFTKHKRRNIAVVEGRNLIGVVSIMDFLNKVLRG